MCQANGEIPYQLTQSQKYYRDYTAKTNDTMHLNHKPGEILQANNSVEVRCYKHDLRLVTIGYFFLLIFLNIVIVSALWEYRGIAVKLIIIYSLLILVMYIPLSHFSYLKYKKMFKKPEDYSFSETVLREVHVVGANAFFTIRIEVENNILSIDTKSVFHVGWKAPHVDEYKDRPVTMGYNTSTNEVIVISKI